MPHRLLLPPFIWARTLLGLLVVAGWSGCGVYPSAVKRDPVTVRQQSDNTYRPPLAGEFTRVAVLPLAGDVQPPDALREMDDSFLAEFNKSQIFEGVAVGAGDLQSITRQTQILSTAALPPQLLPELRRRYGADAVLFTDITQYRPYRPVAIGVHTKMISLRTGEVLWAADAVFDSAEPSVAATARNYNNVTVQNPVSSKPVDTAGTLMSPRRYARFVARELYTRLPGRLVEKR